jgi:hypothetical protein
MTIEPKCTPSTTPSELNVWVKFSRNDFVPRPKFSGERIGCDLQRGNPPQSRIAMPELARRPGIGADNHGQAAARHHRERTKDGVDRTIRLLSQAAGSDNRP